MSIAKRKYLIDQIFSFDHLDQAKILYTDLQNTGLYIADPFNPTITKRKRKSQKTNNCSVTNYGIVTCYDYQSIEFILKRLDSSPDSTLTVLLGGFTTSIGIMVIILNTHEYIPRSIVVNMSWCRRMWSLSSKAHMIAVTGVYYSVLGGAYCSLGKNNSKYAYKAGALAIEQIKLAKRLKDPILECKCWLYFAEDLIQLEKLRKAKKIISRQIEFIELIQDTTLNSLLESVIEKLNIALATTTATVTHNI